MARKKREAKGTAKAATEGTENTEKKRPAKNGKATKEKEGVCKICGEAGKTTVSMKIPGRAGTPPVRQDCMKRLLKELDAGKGASRTGRVEDREITSVKYTGEEVSIGYDQPHGDDKLGVVLESKDEPRASFKTALQALAGPAVAICEIPDEWVEGVAARSVKIKHTDDGIGVVITCVKKLESGQSCCLNSPYTVENNEHGAQLDGSAVSAVEKVMREALAYIDGKRAQGNLFKSAE